MTVSCIVGNDVVMLMFQAVCCSDKLHCCPDGYTCDVAAGTCTKGTYSVSWNAVNKLPSNDVQCPGGEQSCPDKTTCCKMQSGLYGCCPYEEVLVAVFVESHHLFYISLDNDTGITIK